MQGKQYNETIDIMESDWDFSFGDDDTPSVRTTGKETDQEPKEKESKSHRRVKACVTHSDQWLTRRAFSELAVLDSIGIEPMTEGQRMHFITAGDADSLSFLKLVLRHQHPLHHLLFATWVLAAEDILQFDEWLTDGKIERLDCYVGEIFPNQYKVEYSMLREMMERHGCGRIAVFRNHSKIYAGYGDKFHFAIESSANINTNPRTEQTCIEISKPLYDFYKEYFDGIVSFDKRDRL